MLIIRNANDYQSHIVSHIDNVKKLVLSYYQDPFMGLGNNILEFVL